MNSHDSVVRGSASHAASTGCSGSLLTSMRSNTTKHFRQEIPNCRRQDPECRTIYLRGPDYQGLAVFFKQV